MTHTPVLAKEVLSFLQDKTIDIMLDCTLGASGHALLILNSHPEIKTYIGLDKDPIAHQLAKETLDAFPSVRTHRLDFHQADKALGPGEIGQVDVLFADLGVSSMQLDQKERGFSFRQEGPLDMRMDPNNELTAFDIVNTYTLEELTRIFFAYGEEKRARRAAFLIKEQREKKPIKTTKELTDLLEPHLKERKSKKHPLTKIFQALRIEVNGELFALETLLQKAPLLVKKGGLLMFITFHSLEDRLVKHTLRSYSSDKTSTRGLQGLFIDQPPLGALLTRKAVCPSDEEIDINKRSRSAKLRVFQKY